MLHLLHATAPLANSCNSPSDCANVLREVVDAYGRSFPYNASKLHACSQHATLSRLPSHNASAIAHQFVSSCNGTWWSPWEADAYFNVTWQPGLQAGGADCERMTRFGPPGDFVERAVRVHSTKENPKRDCGSSGRRLYEGEGQYAALGDGGKTVCDAESLFRGPGCLVVSVGINANTEFEEALHREHPQCDIVGYDGTLNNATRTRARERAPFLQLRERNFGAELGKEEYRHQTVRLLKIDCDGCEYSALLPWVDSVCTEQIVVEIHRTLKHTPRKRVMAVHKLMMALDKLYRVFYFEPNPAFPWLNTEYSLVRREPCPRRATLHTTHRVIRLAGHPIGQTNVDR